MESIKTISLFSCIILLITSTSAYHIGSEVYNPVQLMKTRLHFYLHDTLSGSNPSAVWIAGPNATEFNPVPFGSLFVMDDAITEGPEPTSKVIGNARGTYISVSRGMDLTLVLHADFAFTSGRFEGSSLNLFSRNPVMESSREVAVVGGRGQFKMAAGTATVTSYYMDPTTGDAILEYNVEVYHSASASASHGLGFVECAV